MPCSLIGAESGGTRVEATLSIQCGTIGVPLAEIRQLTWVCHRASCLYIFGGCWTVRECDIRSDHPAGDAIYCRGTSRLPSVRRAAWRPGTPIPDR